MNAQIPADRRNRVALVTGAARGIGAAVARRLAAQGWCLVLVDTDHDDPDLDYPLATRAELEAVRASCADGGTDALLRVADVRDPEALSAAVAAGVENFGGLDAAVACAGAIAGGTPVWEASERQWRAMLEINLDGVWHTAQAAVPALLSRPEPRQGRFVAVASAAGAVGLPMLAAYCAAKHGVVGLVRSLAAELGGLGVTANVLAPGSTDTAMLRASADIYGLEDPAELAARHLLPRLVEPEEVAAAAVWLCGPDSGAITGAVIPVDAGMTAH